MAKTDSQEAVVSVDRRVVLALADLEVLLVHRVSKEQ